MSGRGARIAVALVATAVTAAAAVLLAQRLAAGRDPAPASVPAPVSTAPITRMTLTQTASVDGTLSHGPAAPLDSRASGTLTWLPEAGAVLHRGDVVLRADEKPVILFYGGVPMYRTLALDTVGGDVAQLEQNLHALGWRGFTVDDTFTEGTQAAVKRWQHLLGVPETGTVDVSAVIYAAGPVRVESRSARPGGSATGTMLACTSVDKVVTASAPATGAAWARPGTRVTVALPGGATVTGVVATIATDADPGSGPPEAPSSGGGTAASAGGGGRVGDGADATMTITITIADQARIPAMDRGPVKIRHTVQKHENVLTVSVAALLAPIEGGYAVEIVDGGRTRLVPVTTGMFADGRVEIRGPGLTAGMIVRVPA